MDFSKYELSDELRATLDKDYQADILGLKAKNAELIEREKQVKVEHEALRTTAEKEKHDAAKALAEKNGSIEDYKAALQAEKDAMINLEATFNQEKSDRILSDSVNDFSGALADDPAGKMYMQKLFQDSVEVKDGLVVPIDTTKSIEELRHSLVSDKANAKYIKADVGSGAGSAGSNGGDGSANTFKGKKMSDMSMSEKVAYLESKHN